MIWYPTIDLVVRINRTFSNGAIVNPTGLQSAVFEARQGAFGQDLYTTLPDKSAALLRGIARNHPFKDGNKRTAVVTADVFLIVNGFYVSPPQLDLVDLTLEVAQGQTELSEIAAHLARWQTKDRWHRQKTEQGMGI